MRSFPALLLLAALWLPAAGPSVAPPLTDEDVVRLFAAGTATAEILAEIERREPDFDLSPEMLRELRNVALPEVLIEAMRDRQQERESREREQLETAALQAAPRLRVRINPGQGNLRVLSVARRIDPQLAAEWELGNAPEDRVFVDLALFVACLSADHVPDHWRSNSPLGRDFISMPRHRMLHFVSGTRGEADKTDEPQGRRVRLVLPDEVELPLEPDVTHDLRLGLALQVGGRYYRLVDDAWPEATLGEGEQELTVRIKGRGPRSFRVRFADDRKEHDDELDDGASADAP